MIEPSIVDTSGFSSAITGGDTLIIPAIQSQNNVASVSGWKISADGTAEFNDVTVRGTIYVIDPDGLFIYDGDPSTGNLILSLTATDGVNNGNAYHAGLDLTSTTHHGANISW